MEQVHHDFTAVVVSFHTGKALDACLDALLSTPLCAQIVLVNNGNPDGVLRHMRELAEHQNKVTLIDGHGNIGFGRGCNLGAKQAREALLVFVNPDCVIDTGTLAAFSDTLARFPDALVGGALRNEDGSEQRGARRGELTPWSALVSFLSLGRAGEAAGIWRDFNRVREAPPNSTCDMPVVSGALFAIAKPKFEQVGGFDPAFFLHVEDIDLCRRLRDSGAPVLFEPMATAFHIGATSTVSSWRVERAKIAGFARYFWKHAKGFFGHLGVTCIVPLIALAITARWFLGRLRPSR